MEALWHHGKQEPRVDHLLGLSGDRSGGLKILARVRSVIKNPEIAGFRNCRMDEIDTNPGFTFGAKELLPDRLTARAGIRVAHRFRGETDRAVAKRLLPPIYTLIV